MRYYREDRYHELAEGIIDAVAVLMMQITPDMKTKIITVLSRGSSRIWTTARAISQRATPRCSATPTHGPSP